MPSRVSSLGSLDLQGLAPVTVSLFFLALFTGQVTGFPGRGGFLTGLFGPVQLGSRRVPGDVAARSILLAMLVTPHDYQHQAAASARERGAKK